jgi:alpha-aminoadipic semialdehyde synthase
MKQIIGIRREDKSRWERRTPLTPDAVEKLVRQGIEVVVEPSPVRIYPDSEYSAAGACISEDLSDSNIVFAVKEIPADFFLPGRTYVFFSHTIKAQDYNMPMLRRMMELGCNLIDYERIVDSGGGRLIFFGRHAGLAGMIDNLWALGQKLKHLGIDTPFLDVSLAYEYNTLADAKKAVADVGERIRLDGLPKTVAPVVFGFAGYGNVCQGAQEILRDLPLTGISPEQLMALSAGGGWSRDRVYSVVFKEENMVEPLDPSASFELQDYYDHPERYAGVFQKYIPHLSVLVNCIYWEEKYPRLLTRDFAAEMYSSPERPKLLVIGDISCDLEGAIECTVRVTSQDNPVYVYDVEKSAAVDGFFGAGPVILAVDNLPCELPVESSRDFSSALLPLVPSIARAASAEEFREDLLPDCVKPALILRQGKLTDDYLYLKEHV